jgi:hypothetical protein
MQTKRRFDFWVSFSEIMKQCAKLLGERTGGPVMGIQARENLHKIDGSPTKILIFNLKFETQHSIAQCESLTKFLSNLPTARAQAAQKPQEVKLYDAPRWSELSGPGGRTPIVRMGHDKRPFVVLGVSDGCYPQKD